MYLILLLEALLLGNDRSYWFLNFTALVDLYWDTDLDVVHGVTLLLLDIVSVGPGHLLALFAGHLLAVFLGLLLALLAGHLLAVLLGHLLAVLFGHLLTVLIGNLLAVLLRHLTQKIKLQI